VQAAVAAARGIYDPATNGAERLVLCRELRVEWLLLEADSPLLKLPTDAVFGQPPREVRTLPACTLLAVP
jgi:hypothetical protein